MLAIGRPCGGCQGLDRKTSSNLQGPLTCARVRRGLSPVNLSLKNALDHPVARLKERAAKHTVRHSGSANISHLLAEPSSGRLPRSTQYRLHHGSEGGTVSSDRGNY